MTSRAVLLIACVLLILSSSTCLAEREIEIEVDHDPSQILPDTFTSTSERSQSDQPTRAATNKDEKEVKGLPGFVPDHRWWDIQARERAVPLTESFPSSVDERELAKLLSRDPFGARDFLMKKTSTDASAWGHLGELYEFGYDYLEADLSLAMKYYEQGAQLGCPRSQTALGLFYETGKVGPVDKAKALLYLTFGSMGGDLTAAHIMGYKYMFGEDVPKNCEQAYTHLLKVSEAQARQFIGQGHFGSVEQFRLSIAPRKETESSPEDVYQYYTDASEAGDSHAQLQLGLWFFKGTQFGIPRDYPTALSYFAIAAERDNAEALAHLGCMYYRGQGAKKDYPAAVKHLRRAISLADTGLAHSCLGEMYARRLINEGASATTSENGNGNGGDEIDYDELAMNHFLKAANHQVPEGQFNAGQYYLYGRPGHPAVVNKAIEMLTNAGNNGHPFAQHQMAMLYYHGVDPRGTCASATSILRRAVQIGELHGRLLSDAHLQYQLGNYDRSLALYERTALMGFVVGQTNAAFLYDKGYAPVVSNATAQESLALYYYELASKQQSPHAYLRLGDFHYYGLGGLPVDMSKAVVYYRHASDLHQPQASFNMGYMHEHGIGVPQDFYLAKRYYDLSLSVNPDSWLAWSVALPTLAARYLAQHGLPTHEILASLNLWAVQSISFHTDTILIIFLGTVLLFALAIRYALSL